MHWFFGAAQRRWGAALGLRGIDTLPGLAAADGQGWASSCSSPTPVSKSITAHHGGEGRHSRAQRRAPGRRLRHDGAEALRVPQAGARPRGKRSSFSTTPAAGQPHPDGNALEAEHLAEVELQRTVPK